ncbi:MAG: DUF1428 domain-containing protein [Xanthomonadales bacterium]|nr:DUF1428 domain-containing protein [Xanthomonadales bacterium]
MYVNGYVIGVPENRKAEYERMANLFVEVISDHGVLEVCETWEADVPDGKLTDFRRAVNAEPGERIVFSWVIWPDRETADRAHEVMMTDPRMSGIAEMPFDGKRMIFGGFEPIVRYRLEDRE